MANQQPSGGRRWRTSLLVAAVFCAFGGCTEDLRLPGAVNEGGSGGSGGSGGRSSRTGGSGGETGEGGSGGRGNGSEERDAGMDLPGRETSAPCRYLSRVRQQTPQVIITLDRSASMWKKYGTSTITRLATVQNALRNVIKTYREAIHFGYLEFPVRDCGEACCASEIIPPNPRTQQLIEKRWSCEFLPATCAQTMNDSPTAVGLKASRLFFAQEDPWHASRHVLLLTDGEPSCTARATENPCTMAVNEVGKLALEHKIFTRVFGLAEEVRGSACLDMMATLGANTQAGQAATHSIAITPEQIYAELDHWLGALSKEACTFRLPSSFVAGQRLTVRADRKMIPQDTARKEGWDYDVAEAPTRVTFYGSYCDQLRTAQVEETEFYSCGPT